MLLAMTYYTLCNLGLPDPELIYKKQNMIRIQIYTNGENMVNVRRWRNEE